MKIKHPCGLVAYLPDDFTECFTIKCPDCGGEFEISPKLASPWIGENRRSCPGCQSTQDEEVAFCLKCGYDYRYSRITEIEVVRAVRKSDPSPEIRQPVRENGSTKPLVSVVAVVIALVIGYYCFGHYKAGQSLERAEIFYEWGNYTFLADKREPYEIKGEIADFTPNKNIFCDKTILGKAPVTASFILIGDEDRTPSVLKVFGDESLISTLKSMTKGQKIRITGNVAELFVKQDDVLYKNIKDGVYLTDLERVP